MILDYIKFYINHAKYCIRNHMLNCKCDKLSNDIDELKAQIVSLEQAKKPKHRIKNGKLELEEL